MLTGKGNPRLPPRIRAAFEKAAQKEERSVSYLIAKILTEWIETRHPELVPPAEELDAARAERLRRAEAAAQLARVPLYDLRGIAGEGEFPAGQTPERHLDLTRGFIRELGAKPERLVALRVAGNAMAPELNDGDVALVDTGATRPRPLSRYVYALCLRGELLLARLRRQEGRLIAIRANPRYPPLDLPADLPDGECQVIGRVAARWQER
jgi:phage repressor protein C with HTH and peptisase S24 domain